MMKRLMVVLLSVVLVLCAVGALAEKSGDYEYAVLEDGTVEITGYTGKAKTLSVPKQLDGKRVTSIGNSAFFYRSSLTSITLPDSVISIGDKAFYECRSLTSITLPDSVTSIGISAFSGCSNLTGITLPDSVTSIGDYAFIFCSNLTSIALPDSVTSMGSNPFIDCKKLQSVNVSSEHPYLATIDGVLFSKADKRLIWYPMTETDACYQIPNGIQIIGYGAFYGCSSLTSITVPDSVMSIGNSAFSGCSGLTDITLPDSVTSIGDYAFNDCSSLTSILLPDSVTDIGGNPFVYCEKLQSVNVSSEHPYLATIDGVLFSKPDKRLIWYPMTQTETCYQIPNGV